MDVFADSAWVVTRHVRTEVISSFTVGDQAPDGWSATGKVMVRGQICRIDVAKQQLVVGAG